MYMLYGLAGVALFVAAGELEYYGAKVLAYMSSALMFVAFLINMLG